MTVRNRRDDAGDIAQRHGGHGGSPGLVESLGQAGPKHDERIRASRKRGEDPGAGHGLVVKKSGPSKGEVPLKFTWSVIAMTSPRFQGFRQPFAFVRTARLIPAATAARARAVTGLAPSPS